MAKRRTATVSAKGACSTKSAEPAKNTGSATSTKTESGRLPVLCGWLDSLTSLKVVVITALVSFLTYANSLGGQFVYDDVDQIVNNPSIRSWSNVVAAFYTHVWQFRTGPEFLRTDVPPPYYRPIFTALITIEYHLFGLWPQGWHLVNIALHTLCAIAVYYVVLELFERKHLAVISALVFAAYPLHAEPVSWISGVTDPLCGLFFLASFYFYLRYRKDARIALLALSLVFFVGSILSKETGLSLPVLIFGYELACKGQGTGQTRNDLPGRFSNILARAALRSAPFFALALLSLVPRVLVLGGLTWEGPFMHKGPITDTFLTLPLIIWTYWAHLIWPVGLTVAYQTHFVTSAASVEFLVPFLGLVVVLVVLFIYRIRISKEVWMSLILILVPLLPVFDLRHLSEKYLIFDRYLYLSVAGLGLLVALAVAKLDAFSADLSKRRNSQYFAGIAAFAFALALGLAILAATRENRVWLDPLSLWSNAVARRPGFWAARYNAGLALMDEKRYDEALAEFKAAAALAPTSPMIFDSMGRTYQLDGNLNEAAASFNQALAIDPNFFESLNNLGTVYFLEGDYRDAQAYFERAVKIRPNAAQARYNLAKCYKSQGRDEDAIREFQSVLAETPDDAETFYELGLVYQKLNRTQEAAQAFRRGFALATSDDLKDQINKALASGN